MPKETTHAADARRFQWIAENLRSCQQVSEYRVVLQWIRSDGGIEETVFTSDEPMSDVDLLRHAVDAASRVAPPTEPSTVWSRFRNWLSQPVAAVPVPSYETFYNTWIHCPRIREALAAHRNHPELKARIREAVRVDTFSSKSGYHWASESIRENYLAGIIEGRIHIGS